MLMYLIIAVVVVAIVLFKASRLWENHLNHAFYVVYSLHELDDSRQRLMKAGKNLEVANSALSRYQLQKELEKQDKEGYEATVKKYCSELIWWEMAQAKLNYMREANIEVLNGKKIKVVREHYDDVIGRMWGQYHENKTDEMIAGWPWPKPHRG